MTADLTLCRHPQGNEEWTAKYQEVGADKELERTLKAKTQRQ